MNQKILVTGGTGFIGSALLLELSIRSNYSALAAIRTSPKRTPIPNVTYLEINGLETNPDWTNALRDVGAIVHCAARAHVMSEKSSNPLAEYRKVNVHATLNLAQQAGRAGVRRFVFLSSIKVNGEATPPHKPFHADDAPAPADSYGVSKREAEEGLLALAKETCMEVVIIRPPLVYGPGVKGNFATMMRWIARGTPLPLGAVRGNQRSFVALDNLVDLIVTCLDHPAAANEVFLAGDGEDLSTTELLQRLAAAMNRSARLIPAPPWMLEAGAAVVGKREVARRLCGSLQVDISKAREVLGWVPPVSVDEGLKRTVIGPHQYR